MLTPSGSQALATVLSAGKYRLAVGVGTATSFSLPPEFFTPTATVTGGSVTFSRCLTFHAQTNVSLVALVDEHDNVLAAHAIKPTTVPAGDTYEVSVRLAFQGES